MGSNSEIEGLAAHRYLRGARAALVATHQPGIADHISRNDCCKSALLTGQRNFPASPPRIIEGLNRPGNDRIGARLWENVCEPRKCRTVFSIGLLPIALASTFGFPID
jgi:hypothetical protein